MCIFFLFLIENNEKLKNTRTYSRFAPIITAVSIVMRWQKNNNATITTTTMQTLEKESKRFVDRKKDKC